VSNKTVVFDLEGNNLLYGITKAHCISTYCIETQEHLLWTNIIDALQYLDSATLLVGHNICGFDFPALYKLYKWVPKCPVVDTFLAGCILWPEETRSIEDWVQILRLTDLSKIQVDDWSVYTPLMGSRCKSDVLINLAVYNYIVSSKHYSMISEALQLEQVVAAIHAQQTLDGVYFFKERALALHAELNGKLKELVEEIDKIAPWKCLVHGVAKGKQTEYKKQYTEGLKNLSYIPTNSRKPFKADGTYTEDTKKYFGDDYPKVKGLYTKVSFEAFNLNNSEEVKDLLLSLGWKPTEYNTVKDKKTGEFRVTSPKLTEDSYDSLPPGIGKTIATYNTLKHRRNFLLSENGTGAIASVRDDGYISADAFTCATPTARYRHSGTICNIPRVTSVYGKELRSLFGVEEDLFNQVGADLSGIEIRMLAHFLLALNLKDARKTADLILSPDKTNDFHSYNAMVWGTDRNTAKTTLYALLYGAGAGKLAGTLGRPKKQGAKIKQGFYKAHPGIEQLIKMLEDAYKRNGGYIKGIDGRPLYVRKVMALLNTLLQNAATIVFKKWMVKCSNLEGCQMIAYGIMR